MTTVAVAMQTRTMMSARIGTAKTAGDMSFSLVSSDVENNTMQLHLHVDLHINSNNAANKFTYLKFHLAREQYFEVEVSHLLCSPLL